MQIVPSCLHHGNPKHLQKRVNSRRWDKAPRWVQERVSSQALKTYLVLQRLTSGQPRRLSKRLLASRRGVSTKTIYNHICELIAARVMRAEYAKVSACRNAPNRYILLDIDGGDLHLAVERNCTEKQEQILKPKATAREARRVENHPPAMQKMYGLIGRLFKHRHKAGPSKGHQYRLQAARERPEDGDERGGSAANTR